MRAHFDYWRFTRYGVIRLRRYFVPKLVRELRAAVLNVYAERTMAAAEVRSLTEFEPRSQARLMSTVSLDKLLAADNRFVHTLVGERVRNLARIYLGKEPSLSENSYIRRLVPGADIQALPFHQDQSVLGAPLLNIWVPLDPCGTAAPGLEVVVTNNRQLLDVSGDPSDAIPVERVRLEEEVVLAAYGSRSLWHPALRPGDALVFAGTTIHRSYVTSAMTEPRMSVELRLV
jgi:Phytanoyl-CoA dioxygenase (PhyH)